MAAGKSHGVVAAIPSASLSSESDLVLRCILDFVFLVEFFPVLLLTLQTFFGGVSDVELDKSESSDCCFLGNFETLGYFFFTRDLFWDWGVLGRRLRSFLFPCCN